jgi:hypothetical protein
MNRTLNARQPENIRGCNRGRYYTALETSVNLRCERLVS